MERRRAQAPAPIPVRGDVDLDQRLCHHVMNCLREGEGCSVLVLRALDMPMRAHPRPTADLAMTARLDEVARRVRMVVRSGDPVEVEERRGIGIVLPAADAAGVQAVRRRLIQVLEQPDAGYSPIAAQASLRLALGCATQPPAREMSAVSALVASALASALVRSACAPVMLVSAVIGEPDRPGAGTECLQARDLQARDLQARDLTSNTAGVQAYASTAETGELEGGGQCDGQCDGTERQPERAADSVGWHEWAAFLSDQARARRARLDDGAQSRALRWRADALGVPYVLGLARQSDGSPRAISPELARELGAVPIGHNRGTLTVAMRDPGDTAAMRRLRLASGMAIFPVLVDQAELERALGEMERALARTTPTGL